MAGLLTLGARAMFANQAALQTIGQNIANANTPGYSRQSVVLTTSPGQYTGAGFFGKGVDVQTVVRSHNDYLSKEAASTKSTAMADATRAEQMSRLEKLFPPGNDGLVIMSDGTKYVSSVRHGGISRIRPGRSAELIAENIPNAASMCYDSGARQLVIPMNANIAIALLTLE